MLPGDVMPRLGEYIGGIIRNMNGLPIAVNGPQDHIHIAAFLNQKTSLMDAIKEIKQSSSHWLRSDVGLTDFQWQEGYAAFSVSESVMPHVTSYIQGQVDHHKKKSFQDELIEFLERHHVQYDRRYVFQ